MYKKNNTMKQVLKLKAMLKAANIECTFDTSLNVLTVINNSQEYLFDKTIIDLDGATEVFQDIKRIVLFRGNPWDGLLIRLQQSNDWVCSNGKWINKYYLFESNAPCDPLHIFVQASLCRNLARYVKPHVVWRLLDKIDLSRNKGGKQVVKFKGSKYSFNFPSNISKPIELVQSKHNIYHVDGPSDLKVEMSANIKDTTLSESTNDLMWKKITDWNSIANIEGDLYWICDSEILPSSISKDNFNRKGEDFVSKKQAQRTLAYLKLCQIYHQLIKRSSTDELQSNDFYCVGIKGETLIPRNKKQEPQFSPFRFEFYNKNQRTHFIKHNYDLLTEYFDIDFKHTLNINS